MKIVLATKNPNKVKEIHAALPAGWEALTATEVGIIEELPETGTTLEANALQKARFLRAAGHGFVLSDDSGLSVVALDGAPGVHSARYASEQKDDAANRAKLIQSLEGQEDRRACFQTVMAYITPKGEYTFYGEVWGHILTEERGNGGFGYDALFVPEEGDGRTFAQMTLEEKKAMSHRTRALKAWIAAI